MIEFISDSVVAMPGVHSPTLQMFEGRLIYWHRVSADAAAAVLSNPH
jgi:hypothetical protein